MPGGRPPKAIASSLIGEYASIGFRSTLLGEAKKTRSADRRDEREGCERSLIEFTIRAWREIGESTALDINWHHEEIAAALEGITHGRGRALIINQPPRTMKTLLTNVCWPAWIWAQPEESWGPLSGPHVRFLCVSYGATLSEEIAVKMRRLVTGEWYQGLWGDRVKIREDQQNRANFANTAGGERMSNSIEGGLLGRGGDIQICFTADQLNLTEHGYIPIGEIVNQRLPIRVWSFNHAIHQFELRPIVGWHRNPSRPVLRIVTSRGDLKCTKDHRILTDRGYVAACDLRIGDRLFAAQDSLGAANLADRGSADAIGVSDLGDGAVSIGDGCDGFGWDVGPCAPIGVDGEMEVLPCAARANTGDDGRTDGITLREDASGFGARSDRPDVDFSQVCRAVPEATMSLHVGDVLGARAVFQAVERGIRAVAEDMSDLLAVRAWAKEGERDEAMDLAIEMFPVKGQSDARISVDWRARHDFPRDADVSGPATDARKALDAPEIGDFVSRKAADRSPTFVRVARIELVHEVPPATYCLTVEHNHNMVMGQANIVAANCDDPHHLKGAESTIQRRETLEGMRSLVTRVTDPRISARVLIMQRLHCLLPGTLVRTPFGQEPVEGLVRGSVVLGSAGWQSVCATSTMPFCGDAYGVRLFGHPEVCWTTPNHRYLTTRGWQRADELLSNDWVRFPLPEGLGDAIPWEEPRRADPPAAPSGSFTGVAAPSIAIGALATLVSEGHKNTAIARRLGVHRNTIQCYLWLYRIGRIREITPWFGRAHLDDPMFWRLVGYWLAEGCLTNGRHNEPCGVRFTFHAAETEYHTDIKTVLSRYGVATTTRFPGNNVCQMTVPSSQLGCWLREHFGSGAKAKAVPEFVFALPPSLRREILEGWLRGDGCTRRTGPLAGQRSGASASIALIHGMQRIALSLGQRVIVVQGRKEQTEVEIHDWRGKAAASWELRLSPIPRREGSMRAKIDETAAWHQIRSIETKAYDGIVYDITTPSHDFVVGNATIHNTDDATNYALEHWSGVQHICYPMRFNEQIAFMQPTDHRSVEGDLLWPTVWTEAAVRAEERELTAYGVAGQLQQSPVPRGGGIILREWWRLWPDDAVESNGMESGYRCPVCRWVGYVRAADADGIACPSCGSLATREVPFPAFSFRLLSVDTNFGEKEENSWSAATCWEVWHGKDDAPRVMLTYAWRGRPHLHATKEAAARGEMGLVERIHDIANRRKIDLVLIEHKTRGEDLYHELARQSVEWPYRLEWFEPTGRGDKTARLNAVSGLFTGDLIWAPNKAWAETVIAEVCDQPRAQFSDLADTCSMGLLYLRHSHLLPTTEEHARDTRRALVFYGNRTGVAEDIEGL